MIVPNVKVDHDDGSMSSSIDWSVILMILVALLVIIVILIIYKRGDAA